MTTQDKLAEALQEMLDSYDGPNVEGAGDKLAAVIDARHALKLHAAEAAQAAEPFGWVDADDLKELAANRADSEDGVDAIQMPVASHPFGKVNVPVYTAPQPRSADDPCMAIGAWLSAALGDPEVCEEMKADINRWFDAGKPQIQFPPDISELVQFFRDEGHYMGRQGDDYGWTPEHTAVVALRELRKINPYPVLPQTEDASAAAPAQPSHPIYQLKYITDERYAKNEWREVTYSEFVAESGKRFTASRILYTSPEPSDGPEDLAWRKWVAHLRAAIGGRPGWFTLTSYLSATEHGIAFGDTRLKAKEEA